MLWSLETDVPWPQPEPGASVSSDALNGCEHMWVRVCVCAIKLCGHLESVCLLWQLDCKACLQPACTGRKLSPTWKGKAGAGGWLSWNWRKGRPSRSAVRTGLPCWTRGSLSQTSSSICWRTSASSSLHCKEAVSNMGGEGRSRQQPQLGLENTVAIKVNTVSTRAG